jgi:hypothetical protein
MRATAAAMSRLDSRACSMSWEAEAAPPVEFRQRRFGHLLRFRPGRVGGGNIERGIELVVGQQAAGQRQAQCEQQ